MSLPDAPVLRSFLYAPGSAPRILAKVLGAGADAVVLDLEDAVPADQKVAAREAVAAMIAGPGRAARSQLHVRVNPGSGGYDRDDLGAVVSPGLAAIRLPKCENPADIRGVAELLDTLEPDAGLAPGTVRLYPTIESAAGLDRARDLAAASPRVAALAFGPADFAADLGLRDGDDRDATLLVRSQLVVASRLAGIGAPVDGAYIDLSNLDGLRRVCTWVRALGFVGKSAIHPRQLPVLHDVFTPTDQEVAEATRIVSSLDDGRATAVVDGGFVDPAVVARAEAVLQLHRDIHGQDRPAQN